MNEREWHNPKIVHGMIWRVGLTIAIAALLLIGSLVYAAFYANGYTLFQKLVILLIALITAVALISFLWVHWVWNEGITRAKR